MYLIECVSLNHDHACFGNGSLYKKEIIRVMKSLRCGSYERIWALTFFAPIAILTSPHPIDELKITFTL